MMFFALFLVHLIVCVTAYLTIPDQKALMTVVLASQVACLVLTTAWAFHIRKQP